MFKELTDTNIQNYTKKNQEILYENIIKFQEEADKKLGFDETLFLSKEDYEKYMKEDKERVRRDVEFNFNVENCKKHDFVLPELDISLLNFPIFKNMVEEGYETLCIIEIEEDKIKNIHSWVGSACSVSVTTQDIFKHIIKNNINKFAMVHNHPNSIVANFTENDVMNNYILGFYCKTFDIDFVDSYVITEFDCESQYQSDQITGQNNLKPNYKNEKAIDSIMVKALKNCKKLIF